MNKINLFGKNEEELRLFCKSLNYPEFHGNQLYKWMYQKSTVVFDNMSNLPKSLIEILNKKCNMHILEIEKLFKSNLDKTTKFLLKTNDSKLIECVSMIDKNRHTICLSSQIGCSVDCSFCATGRMGIIRNLNVGEIIQQLIIINWEIKTPITNIVFMGMGEPFLNYTNVLKACYIINNTNGFNISSKKITISTSGILPKIKKFIDDKIKFKLAVSLNASSNAIRDKLIPINKKWPIESLINELKKYKFNKYRPIMFEYVLMENINDSEKDAKLLIEILKSINCKINVIPYNSISKDYSRPEIEKIEKFAKILNESKYQLKTLIRWSKGQDINAACGQLATVNES
jgi:23S rRNA (adenine2503-C2)-methyltransferase